MRLLRSPLRPLARAGVVLAVCSLPTIHACGTPDEGGPATTAGGTPTERQTAATAAAGQPISLADIAGRWKMRAVPENGGRPTEFDLEAAARPVGWTIKYPRRPPVPLLIAAVDGDSIVAEAGPYESFRRPGIKVRTFSVIRHDGRRLHGRLVAHYQTGGVDSVQTFVVEGTRAQ